MVADGPAVVGMADRMTIVASNDVCEDSLVKLNSVCPPREFLDNTTSMITDKESLRGSQSI